MMIVGACIFLVAAAQVFIESRRLGLHYSHFLHFWRLKMQKVQKCKGESNFTINAMTDFLKMNPGETSDEILESALRH